MKDGDYIVAINEQDVKWSPHDQVVTLIKKSGNSLKLKLVTPMDKSHAKEKVNLTILYINILRIMIPTCIWLLFLYLFYFRTANE